MNSSQTALGVFHAYPERVRCVLLGVRELILSVGNSIEEIGVVEESVKWGEPSYTTLSGSAVRLGWKSSSPQEIGVYFHCRTSLVQTFRKVYGADFKFEGNRAIKLPLNAEIPEIKLRHCIELALTYHRRKHLPDLGVGF
jgi:hypothetical protein